MGETAEVLADDYNISRQEQDEFALQSHRRATEAQKHCFFSEEIVPVPADLAGQEVKQDFGPRTDQTLEALGRLQPFFKQGGTVTVGNSCSITDGAAAVLLMSGRTRPRRRPGSFGYLRAFAYAGCDPKRMGLGPAFATSKLLERTGLALKDIDLIELNEAFAAQVIANERAFASPRFALDQLGPTRCPGYAGSRTSQRQRRCDCPGPSGRRHRHTAGHHPPQRTPPPRQETRAGDSLRRRRTGSGPAAGNALMPCFATLP